jgi:hypothetical protein
MVPKYNIMFHLETNLIEIYLFKLLVPQRYIHDNFMIWQHSLREMSYTISVCLNYYHHSMKFAFKTSETSTNIIHLQLQSSESTNIMIAERMYVNVEHAWLVQYQKLYAKMTTNND